MNDPLEIINIDKKYFVNCMASQTLTKSNFKPQIHTNQLSGVHKKTLQIQNLGKSRYVLYGRPPNNLPKLGIINLKITESLKILQRHPD